MDEHTRDPGVAPPLGTPAGWRPIRREWEHATLRRATEHAVRLHNDAAYLDAYDCVKYEWYNYGDGTRESKFCHGLQQAIAARHKHDVDVPEGARSLARTARKYLQDTPADFYGLDVGGLRDTLAEVESEPDAFDGFRLVLDGEPVTAYPADYAFADDLP
ncbi:DUF309 domain-containing protein [Halocalculus aciditolerans]|uniref:DUF309 domain-containing protein n=1 Tax=Halocalculus aciditolerans TaxID=1383812 RepID=A0A830FJW6_9EURY|nr:DUF309 domain-containing protein [Halocalculus aciditolerans]GGL62995.1 hypothetical protein GCM10009039_21150 [Halocalculus aciditolerans]